MGISLSSVTENRSSYQNQPKSSGHFSIGSSYLFEMQRVNKQSNTPEQSRNKRTNENDKDKSNSLFNNNHPVSCISQIPTKGILKFQNLKKKVTKFKRRIHNTSIDYPKVFYEFISTWSQKELQALKHEYDAINILKEISKQADDSRPSVSMLANDFDVLFKTGICADTEISYRGEIFQVHRAILSIRSTFFRQCFYSWEAQPDIMLISYNNYSSKNVTRNSFSSTKNTNTISSIANNVNMTNNCSNNSNLCDNSHQTRLQRSIPVNLDNPSITPDIFRSILQYIYTEELDFDENQIDNWEMIYLLREKFHLPNRLQLDMKRLFEDITDTDCILSFSQTPEFVQLEFSPFDKRCLNNSNCDTTESNLINFRRHYHLNNCDNMTTSISDEEQSNGIGYDNNFSNNNAYELPCHRAILASRSSFFRRIIEMKQRNNNSSNSSTNINNQDNMKNLNDGQQLHITLEENIISHRYARVLLYCIYTGQLNMQLIVTKHQLFQDTNSSTTLDLTASLISGGNNSIHANDFASSGGLYIHNFMPTCLNCIYDVMQLYQIGCFIDFKPLCHGAEDLLINSISLENFLDLLAWSSKSYGSTFVRRHVIGWIREEFLQIISSRYLVLMTKLELIEVISSQFTQAPEAEILAAVLKWAEAKIDLTDNNNNSNISSNCTNNNSKITTNESTIAPTTSNTNSNNSAPSSNSNSIQPKEPNGNSSNKDILTNTSNSLMFILKDMYSKRAQSRNKYQNDPKIAKLIIDFLPYINFHQIYPGSETLLNSLIRRGIIPASSGIIPELGMESQLCIKRSWCRMINQQELRSDMFVGRPSLQTNQLQTQSIQRCNLVSLDLPLVNNCYFHNNSNNNNKSNNQSFFCNNISHNVSCFNSQFSQYHCSSNNQNNNSNGISIANNIINIPTLFKGPRHVPMHYERIKQLLSERSRNVKLNKCYDDSNMHELDGNIQPPGRMNPIFIPPSQSHFPLFSSNTHNTNTIGSTRSVNEQTSSSSSMLTYNIKYNNSHTQTTSYLNQRLINAVHKRVKDLQSGVLIQRALFMPCVSWISVFHLLRLQAIREYGLPDEMIGEIFNEKNNMTNMSSERNNSKNNNCNNNNNISTTIMNENKNISTTNQHSYHDKYVTDGSFRVITPGPSVRSFGNFNNSSYSHLSGSQTVKLSRKSHFINQHQQDDNFNSKSSRNINMCNSNSRITDINSIYFDKSMQELSTTSNQIICQCRDRSDMAASMKLNPDSSKLSNCNIYRQNNNNNKIVKPSYHLSTTQVAQLLPMGSRTVSTVSSSTAAVAASSSSISSSKQYQQKHQNHRNYNNRISYPNVNNNTYNNAASVLLLPSTLELYSNTVNNKTINNSYIDSPILCHNTTILDDCHYQYNSNDVIHGGYKVVREKCRIGRHKSLIYNNSNHNINDTDITVDPNSMGFTCFDCNRDYFNVFNDCNRSKTETAQLLARRHSLKMNKSHGINIINVNNHSRYTTLPSNPRHDRISHNENDTIKSHHSFIQPSQSIEKHNSYNKHSAASSSHPPPVPSHYNRHSETTINQYQSTNKYVTSSDEIWCRDDNTNNNTNTNTSSSYNPWVFNGFNFKTSKSNLLDNNTNTSNINTNISLTSNASASTIGSASNTTVNTNTNTTPAPTTTPLLTNIGTITFSINKETAHSPLYGVRKQKQQNRQQKQQNYPHTYKDSSSSSNNFHQRHFNNQHQHRHQTQLYQQQQQQHHHHTLCIACSQSNSNNNCNKPYSVKSKNNDNENVSQSSVHLNYLTSTTSPVVRRLAVCHHYFSNNGDGDLSVDNDEEVEYDDDEEEEEEEDEDGNAEVDEDVINEAGEKNRCKESGYNRKYISNGKLLLSGSSVLLTSKTAGSGCSSSESSREVEL